MNPQMFLGLIARHALTLLGGALVHQGYIDGSEVPVVTGAVATLGGVLWSIAQKRQLMKRLGFGG